MQGAGIFAGMDHWKSPMGWHGSRQVPRKFV